jgi:hypothetical protein
VRRLFELKQGEESLAEWIEENQKHGLGVIGTVGICSGSGYIVLHTVTSIAFW